MESSEEKVVAVIMVGGPTKGKSASLVDFLFLLFLNFLQFFLDFFFPGTRFRPLSFNTPKPLFPLAGQAMVHHPISACKRVSFAKFSHFLLFGSPAIWVLPIWKMLLSNNWKKKKKLSGIPRRICNYILLSWLGRGLFISVL